jgi:hypothetical protein
MLDHPVVVEACCGDADALAYLQELARALHLWDDLVDRDHPLDPRHLDATFTAMLVTLPLNPFVRAHAEQLMPVLLQAIINWKAATVMERAPRDATDLHGAFVIRSSYVDMVSAVAALKGGLEFAARIAMDVRRWAHGEGYDGYLTNLAAEQAAREGAVHVLR